MGKKVDNLIYVICAISGVFIYVQTDSMILTILVGVLSLIVGMEVKSAIQSKNRRKAENTMSAYSSVKGFNELTNLAEAPSMHLNELSAQGVKVAFIGRSEYTETEKTTGIITPDFCYVKFKKTVLTQDSGVDFVEAKRFAKDVQFQIEKYEYKISGHCEMDVEKAAMLGHGLGGVGAGISAAANAAKINSEGGLLVHQTMTAYNIILLTPGQESILEELYLTEGGKLIKVEIPSRMDKKTANNIVLRLNAVLNGLNK